MTLHGGLDTSHAVTREGSHPQLDPRGDDGVGGALDKQLVKQALFPRRADPARIGRFTASALSNLALAHESTGAYAEAIPLRRSIAIYDPQMARRPRPALTTYQRNHRSLPQSRRCTD